MTVGLWFDWTGAGFDSIPENDGTALLTRAQYQRGGRPEITGAASTGSATFVLLNPDGLFDPDNASSPLYGLLTDGVRVWFGMNEDGTLTSGGTVRGRFAGRTLSISPLPEAGAGDSTPTVEIVCEDALGWYSRIDVALGEDCSPTPPPSLSPIHAWTLCETSGPAVDFIAGEDGTYNDLNADMTRGVSGPGVIPSSGGVQTTGTGGPPYSDVSIDDDGIGFVAGNADRSIEWWFQYATAFLGTATVIYYGTGGFTSFLVYIGADGPIIEVGGGPNTGAIVGLIDPSALDGDWHYACVTYRGSTRTVSAYLDGTFQWTDTFPSPLDTVPGTTALIFEAAPLQTYAQSSLAMYDRVLADSEIAAHAAGTYPFTWPACGGGGG